MRRSFFNFCIALVLTCLCSTAFAQVTVEGFEPRPTQESDILNVSTATVSPHLLPTVGLFTHFVDDALIYRPADALDSGTSVRALDNQLKTELAFALGLFNWIDIGFVLPITVFQEGDARTAFGLGAVDSFAMADPRLSLKTKLLPERIAGFGAALLLTVLYSQRRVRN